ncbi:MAG: hypothetical protein QG594_2583 [Bacteroidota bacterium]|nr:hypothetical protein [Bacteroidota bacterium]
MKKVFVFIFVFATHVSAQNKVWSVDKANAWSKNRTWLRGANFQPSTAINQLEMFQAETFDTITIDKELSLAEDLGMNCMRVFIHHLAWETDKEGFKKRLNKYLEISSKHKIGTMLVFFDDCWSQTYKAGKQPDPKLGIHNSGWLRDPGDLIFTDSTLIVTLEEYVKDILTTFANDKRIIIWDLYNEPGNNGLKNKSLPLVKKVFEWARAVNPSQPLTSGIWLGSLKDLNKFQLENSDIISYHNYEYVDEHHKQIDSLKRQFGRPMICSEYMARSKGSLFQTIMPLLKNENVGAINWGFVAGKTNTIFAWDSPIKTGQEPVLWFHDILRKNGTPFSEDEIKTIKKLTGKIK